MLIWLHYEGLIWWNFPQLLCALGLMYSWCSLDKKFIFLRKGIFLKKVFLSILFFIIDPNQKKTEGIKVKERHRLIQNKSCCSVKFHLLSETCNLTMCVEWEERLSCWLKHSGNLRLPDNQPDKSVVIHN